MQAWVTSTQVSFCAKAFPAVPAGHPDAPALIVLGPFLKNGFLHGAVREKGGAYGAGASWDPDTASFRMYSYRDPRLAGTLADFDEAARWVAGGKHEPRQLEEAILGVIADVDRPESPAGEALKAWHATLHGRTPEYRRAFRRRILEVTIEDLRRVAQAWLDPGKASTAVVTDKRILDQNPGLGLDVEQI
jgi:hypothetical protein